MLDVCGLRGIIWPIQGHPHVFQPPLETPTADIVPAEPAVVAGSTSQDETNAGVARASGLLALGNIASRALGLAREVALSNLFGATRSVDAFNIALIIPKTIHDLLIAGHVNSAIVPVLSETVTKEGQNALWRLLSVLLSMVTALMAFLVILLQVFAHQAVSLVSGGADAETQALAVELLRLTAPALLFLALFALASGALYALRSFTRPAFAGVLFNGAVVAGMIALAPALGIAAAAVGWLIGALVQLALQLPGLQLSALRPTLRWRHPAVRRIALLYMPVMVSLILDTLVRTFSYNVASGTGEGSISYMNWATTLIQFPHGLVGTAISIAVLPTLARQAALVAQEGQQPFKNTLGLGLRLVITLIVPATAGLYLLAQPIVALIFEHGAFTAQDTVVTVQAVRWYLFGLPFAALDLLLVYAFYARQDTFTPALIGFFSLLVYLGVTIALLPSLGLFSLMIADSVKHMVHSTASALLLHRRLGGMGGQHLTRTTLQTAAAASIMAVVLGLLEPPLASWIGGATWVQEIILVAVSSFLSVGVFLAAALVLRIKEINWLLRMLHQRIRR
jgi:putative peptidoglycan lipid II flippase